VNAFRLFLKIVTLAINKIHIRYEDDFFVPQQPYSFGLVLDSFKVFNYDKDVKFDEPLDIKYTEFWPAETDNLYLKKIELNDLWVYWNSSSPSYIPESLLEETKSSWNKIFEAVGAD